MIEAHLKSKVIKNRAMCSPCYFLHSFSIVFTWQPPTPYLSTFLTQKPHNQLSLKGLPTVAFVDIFIC